MELSVRQKITRNLLNIRGWRTTRKIVVIESDDWGTIRMASQSARQVFLAHQLPVQDCPYATNDALESNDDLAALFDTLTAVKDSQGKAAIITANNIVANPDFEKIKASGFTQYFYEPFTTTLKKYPAHDKVESLYRQGIKEGIFIPQFHGREHLNIQRWLTDLQRGDTITRLAFEQNMFSIHAHTKPAVVNEYMDALDADSEAQLQSQHQVLKEGLDLFKAIWGYPSKSFIAPCYTWSTAIEPTLAKYGVKYIQGVVNQLHPVLTPGYQYKKIYHYQAQKNKLGQRYLVRNVFFEPAMNKQFDWVSDALHRTGIAFRWGKPAIISTHRLNYIGFINEKNRTANLLLLAELLKKIKEQWPEVEFMSSDQLGDTINNTEK